MRDFSICLRKNIQGKSILELIRVYIQKFRTVDGDTVSSVEDVAQKLWIALTTDKTINIVTDDDRSLMVDCCYMLDGCQMLVARDVSQVIAAKVRLEMAINAMPLGFAYYDNELKLVACNKGYEDLIQEKKEWIAEQQPEQIIAAMLRHVKGARKQSLEVRSSWYHRALDDIENRRTTTDVLLFEDNRWIEVNTKPASDTGIITIANDITDRKNLELDLEKNEAQLRETLQGQPFPVLVIRDEDSEVLFASTAAIITLLGAGENLSPGKALRRINMQPQVIGPIFKALDNEVGDLQEIELSRMGGETFPALLSSQAIRYSNSRATVISFIDISTIQNLESELAVQQEALFQSEKLNALGTLLAGIAHELNNPLTVVLGTAQNLVNSTEDKSVRQQLRRINAAADQCAKIVRSFLNAARKQSDETNMFDLGSCIQGSLELASIGFKEEDIELSTEIEADLPEIDGNSYQISQVVMNLVLNAKQPLKNMDTPRQIKIKCHRSVNKSQIELHIIDNGPGIPEENLDRIFEPFFTTKPQGEGTGMGLSLTHGIVTSHGGTIEVVRHSQSGAHFKICFPIDTSQTSDISSLQQDKGLHSSYRLLLVDDEPDVLATLADTLTIQGHEVYAVVSGQEALVALNNQEFDALLSDIRMPGMDGPALFSRVQKEFPAMVQKTAFITGNDMSKTTKEFLASCQRPFLRKPCSSEEILSLLEEMSIKKND